ncbi:L-lysine 6-transaminase [Chlorobiota bacterium]|nr:L-lysine 6-transaminase [Chlorobiota bacterium]
MNIKKIDYSPKYVVEADAVLHELGKYMLADGFEIVYDICKSHGVYLHDAITGKDYLDFFTCFASNPIGLNHPKMTDPAFIEYLGKISVNKPSNSDLYSEAMASFVKTFFAIAVPDYFIHSFYVEGGALAIENALKVAFDWKVKKNFSKGYTIEKGHKILHFNQAFHGRSGYTMSLTNTDPNKTALYPKFDWPRVSNPYIVFPIQKNLEDLIERENKSIREIKQAFINNPDDIAAIIIEPIQGEGGDNHFRPEFLQQLREIANEEDALLIFDEVQTGVGLTGTMWAHEQLGVKPDILAFGKKMQVCGILATNRVDEVPDNVFRVSSRINSTWGGSLTDMVRATRYLEIIQEDNILDNVKNTGNALQSLLHELQQEFPMIISNCRGRGLFSAFDFPDVQTRKKCLHNCLDRGLIILACGEKSVRFRPALTLQIKELEEGMNIIRDSIISS